jgi:membrane fusion protein, multidrug efflux system
LLARVVARDVPITLEGLGTVTAYKTVNVRTQVDGRLDKVVFREGQTVKRGELLAQIDPRPFEILLHQGQAAMARDEGQLHGAERNLERYQAVVEKQLIPQQQVDDQRALVEQYGGAVQGDKVQVENARLQLDYARIKSPIDGVTGVRQVDPGNLVHASDANGIVVVTQLDPIAVLFTLPEDDLPRVAPAQAAAPLTVDALSRDGTQTLATGKLELVDNQINQSTATIRLKAIFPNPQHTLWPNQFVKARLRLDVHKGALVIPAVAIQRGPQGVFVYVVGADDKAQSRPVTLDVLVGDEAIMAKGLQVGDQVVIEGQSQLRPGSKVVSRAGGGDGAGGARGRGAEAANAHP